VAPPPHKTQNEKTEEHSLLLLQEEEQSPFYMSIGNGTKGGTQPASSSQIHEEEKHSNRTKKLKNILIRSNQSSSLKLCFEKTQQEVEEESEMPSFQKLKKFQAKRSLRFNPMSVSLVNAAEVQG